MLMSGNKKFWVVVYDVRNNKKRRRIAKALETYGVRINRSVFECKITDAELLELQEKIDTCISRRIDTVVYYPLCRECQGKAVYRPRTRKAGKKAVNVV